MNHTVAIVGRPNVGKSTLFNRLTGHRKAIVDDESGITRDRHYGKVDWNGKTFSLIDTGGYVPDSDNLFEKAIREQVLIAMEEASIILFLVDTTTGITLIDDHIADMLRRSEKLVVVVANKVDHNMRVTDVQVFHALGLGEPMMASSVSGSGTGELLDKVTSMLPNKPEQAEDETAAKIAIVGQPNVGKSSMFNLICGEERTIVTDIAGTTRDVISYQVNRYGLNFELIDTAGLRRKSKIKENIEFYSILRTNQAIEQADVCILMVDAQIGITQQDLSIFKTIIECGRGVVLAINKWDLVEQKEDAFQKKVQTIKEKTAPFTDVPIHFISVLEKQRVIKLLEEALKVYKRKTYKIPTHKLNETILPYIERFTPPMTRGRSIKIKFISQLKSSRPLFSFYANYPQHIKEPYKRFLENKIRTHFDFCGVPMKIIFKQK